MKGLKSSKSLLPAIGRLKRVFLITRQQQLKPVFPPRHLQLLRLQLVADSSPASFLSARPAPNLAQHISMCSVNETKPSLLRSATHAVTIVTSKLLKWVNLLLSANQIQLSLRITQLAKFVLKQTVILTKQHCKHMLSHNLNNSSTFVVLRRHRVRLQQLQRHKWLLLYRWRQVVVALSKPKLRIAD